MLLSDAKDVTLGEEVDDGEGDCGPSLPIGPNCSYFQASVSLDAEQEPVLRSLDAPFEDAEGVTPGEEVEVGKEDCGCPLPLERNRSGLQASFSFNAGKEPELQSMDVLFDVADVTPGEVNEDGEEEIGSTLQPQPNPS